MLISWRWRTVLLILAASLLAGASVYVILPTSAASDDRASLALQKTGTGLRQRAADLNLTWPMTPIFLRGLKQEKQLEVWVYCQRSSEYVLFKSYPIRNFSGTVGPKRKQGDKQVPEGVYFIDRFNPRSQFHLSLGINYPNASDRIRGEAGNLGGDIFIHGSIYSIGCLAMTDALIKEIYTIADQARSAGQRQIPVHLFPGRLDEEGWNRLSGAHGKNEALMALWEELRPIYLWFENKRTLPDVTINKHGGYHLRNSSSQ